MVKNSLKLFLGMLLIFAFVTGSQPLARAGVSGPSAAVAQTTEAKVDLWLKNSGYNFRKTGKATWLINHPDLSSSEMPLLVAAGPDFVVIGVVVEFKKNLSFSKESMFKLLRLSHSIDYVKIGFDDDEDLFVRAEVKTKLLDQQEFKNIVETCARAAVRIRGELA